MLKAHIKELLMENHHRHYHKMIRLKRATVGASAKVREREWGPHLINSDLEQIASPKGRSILLYNSLFGARQIWLDIPPF
jgi:hypothetical protein